jgi:hypothetical protein
MRSTMLLLVGVARGELNGRPAIQVLVPAQ